MEISSENIGNQISPKKQNHPVALLLLGILIGLAISLSVKLINLNGKTNNDKNTVSNTLEYSKDDTLQPTETEAKNSPKQDTEYKISYLSKEHEAFIPQIYTNQKLDNEFLYSSTLQGEITKTYINKEEGYEISYPSQFQYYDSTTDEERECDGICPDVVFTPSCENIAYKSTVAIYYVSRPLKNEMFFRYPHYDDVQANLLMQYSLEKEKWEEIIRPGKDQYVYALRNPEDTYRLDFPISFTTKNTHLAHFYGHRAYEDGESRYTQKALIENQSRDKYIEIDIDSGTNLCGGLMGTEKFLEIINSVKFTK